jgi:S-adenosylmethionine hydrolase
LRRREIRGAFHVKRRDLFLEEVSETFHGRDIFAPVAARLLRGLRPEEVGPEVKHFRYETLPRPRRRRRRGEVEVRGEVVYVDRFGNATTNIRPVVGACLVDLSVRDFTSAELSRTYGSVRKGRPLVLKGSTGYVEIAVAGSSAERELGLCVGDRVVSRWRE